jgi:hypothetical protein
MKTKLEEIKIMLALYGAPMDQLDFSRPCDLARSLHRAIKYERISESCEKYIIKKRLLAWPGYNKYEVEPLGAWI